MTVERRHFQAVARIRRPEAFQLTRENAVKWKHRKPADLHRRIGMGIIRARLARDLAFFVNARGRSKLGGRPLKVDWREAFIFGGRLRTKIQTAETAILRS